MLDGNKDNVKVDAMKRIINVSAPFTVFLVPYPSFFIIPIQLVARGKDMSELFPNIVKNVAAKNLELKKLVYVYLERYRMKD